MSAEPSGVSSRPDTGVLVRPAALADLARVVDLAVEMVTHSISPYRSASEDHVKEYRRTDLQSLYDALGMPDAGVFVAEDRDGRFLGHVVVLAGRSESSTGEPQGWVFDLCVVPDAWGLGIGRQLMERAEAFVRSRGHRYLGLGVTSANQRAVEFYEGLGYHEERKQMVKVLDE